MRSFARLNGEFATAEWEFARLNEEFAPLNGEFARLNGEFGVASADNLVRVGEFPQGQAGISAGAGRTACLLLDRQVLHEAPVAAGVNLDVPDAFLSDDDVRLVPERQHR